MPGSRVGAGVIGPAGLAARGWTGSEAPPGSPLHAHRRLSPLPCFPTPHRGSEVLWGSGCWLQICVLATSLQDTCSDSDPRSSAGKREWEGAHSVATAEAGANPREPVPGTTPERLPELVTKCLVPEH